MEACNVTIEQAKDWLADHGGVLKSGNHECGPDGCGTEACVREVHYWLCRQKWTDGTTAFDRACQEINDATWSSDQARTDACLPLVILDAAAVSDGWIEAWVACAGRVFLPMALGHAAIALDRVDMRDHAQVLREMAHAVADTAAAVTVCRAAAAAAACAASAAYRAANADVDDDNATNAADAADAAYRAASHVDAAYRAAANAVDAAYKTARNVGTAYRAVAIDAENADTAADYHATTADYHAAATQAATAAAAQAAAAQAATTAAAQAADAAYRAADAAADVDGVAAHADTVVDAAATAAYRAAYSAARDRQLQVGVACLIACHRGDTEPWLFADVVAAIAAAMPAHA